MENTHSEMPTPREWPPRDPVMDDLYEVGVDKPLGYLPQHTIEAVSRESVEDVAALCGRNGLTTLLLADEECHIASGALYVYEHSSLQALLDQNIELLKKYGWPTDPAGFAREVTQNSVDSVNEPDLFRLIAYAFRDPRPQYQRPNPESWHVPVSPMHYKRNRRASILFLNSQ